MDVFLYCGLTNFVIKKKKINEHPFKTRVKVPSANSLFVTRYTQIATTNTNSPSRIPWNILANIIFLTLALRFTSLQAMCKRSEHTSELQSRFDLVCRLLLEKKKHTDNII